MMLRNDDEYINMVEISSLLGVSVATLPPFRSHDYEHQLFDEVFSLFSRVEV